MGFASLNPETVQGDRKLGVHIRIGRTVDMRKDEETDVSSLRQETERIGFRCRRS